MTHLRTAENRHFVSFRRQSRLLALACLSVLATVAGGCEESAATPEPAAAPKPPKPKPKPKLKPPVVVEPEIQVPKTPESLEAAEQLATEIYTEHRRSFFCNCAYTTEKKVARGTCGYKTRADESLARRVAWERVVPVRAFGAHLPCWKEPLCSNEQGEPYSGVACCSERDPVFKAMATDLHNLVPMVSELKADRSNFPFGEIEREPRMYGACDFEVSWSRAIAEPSERVRGDIARIYLYMRDTYGAAMPLPGHELEMLKQWDKADPADAWEVTRNKKIASIQGLGNDNIPLSAQAPDSSADSSGKKEAQGGKASKGAPAASPPTGSRAPAAVPGPSAAG